MHPQKPARVWIIEKIADKFASAYRYELGG